MTAKGTRSLDEQGRWMCKRGHDKNVTGVYSQNRCRMCHMEFQRAWGKQKRKQNPEYSGERMEIPAEAFKNLRETFGFSQRQLAHLSGVSRTEIGCIEQGKRKPGWAVRRKLNLFFAPLIENRQERIRKAGV